MTDLTEDTAKTDAVRVREMLMGISRERPTYQVDGTLPPVVNLQCFNDVEAHEIAAYLDESERKRVMFGCRFVTGADGPATLGRFAPTEKKP